MFHKKHWFCMGICADCGIEHDRKRSKKDFRPAGYCNKCHALREKERRALCVKGLIKIKNPPRGRIKQRDMSDEEKLKANCRSYANVYQRRGKLKKEPCEKCGCLDSHKHHENYSKPLEVRWFCIKCHSFMHKLKRRGS
jgi:hypothetical protein